MRVVAVSARKGGVGKTTATLNLAVAGLQAGYRVAVVDLDPQASASEWADSREGGPDVISCQAVRLERVLDALKKNADLVLIDCPPTSGEASYRAIQAADLVLIPTRIAAVDIGAVLKTFDTAEGREKTTIVFVNDEPVSRRKSLVEETRALLAKRKIEVAPIVWHSRIVFSESMDEGKTVLEVAPDSPAAEEVRALFALVENLVKPKSVKSENAQTAKA